MIRLQVNGVVGYGVSPDIEEPLLSQVLYDLPPGSRIACLDLPTNRNVLYLLVEAERLGHEIVTFITEHLPDTRVEQVIANKMRRCLGEAARIYSRRASQSTTGLVGVSEFYPAGVNVVFFHVDADGLLAYLRGVGLTYPMQVNDANSIDGERGLSLSPTGNLLMMSWSSTVLPYNVWPHHHDEAWTEIGENLIRLIDKGDPHCIAAYIEKVVAASKRARHQAREAAQLTQRVPGRIALCDMREMVRERLVVHRTTWQRRVEGRHGAVLTASVVPGSYDDMVHVRVPRRWDSQLDIRELLPPGMRGRLASRAKVPAKLWPEFWRKCIASERLNGLAVA